MVSHVAGSLFYFVLTKEARQLHYPVFGLFQVLLEIDISHRARGRQWLSAYTPLAGTQEYDKANCLTPLYTVFNP